MGREALARQLALAVARRHAEHQPVDLAALDPFELLGDQAMVAGRAVAREPELGEADD